MIAASVGFQCPDEVRVARRDMRAPRTATGGRPTDGVPRLTYVLVGLNTAVYLAGLGLGDLSVRFGNIALAQDGGGLIGVADGQYYRLLTAAFLHAGAFHLLTNMFALYTIGPQLEIALGRVRFAALYALAALGGSTLSFLVSAPNQLGVGASGAIFGLFGAFYVVVRKLGGDTRSIVALIVINIVITFSIPIIDWRAHVGGLLVGSVVATAFAYIPAGPRRGVLQLAACVAVALLLSVAVAVRTSALTS